MLELSLCHRLIWLNKEQIPAKKNSINFLFSTEKIFMSYNWRFLSLSKLTTMISNIELTHLGSEAPMYIDLEGKII